MTCLDSVSCSFLSKQCIMRGNGLQPPESKKSEKLVSFLRPVPPAGPRFRFPRAEKRENDLHFPQGYVIVRIVNCNGGRFALQRGKSGLHRAGSPSSRRMSRGQPRGKESATENRPPGVSERSARVKRRCKRPPGFGAIRAAWQAPSGARPNRGRCRCPRRYQSRVLAA